MTSTHGENDAQRPDPISIIVNARRHAWAQKKISFEEVVALAYPASESFRGTLAPPLAEVVRQGFARLRSATSEP